MLDNFEIGRKIKKARKEAGLTQEQLGKKLRITWEMISRYENGRSSAKEKIERIAQYTEKPISYFYGLDDDLIGDNIERIAEALKKKGIGYLPSTKQREEIHFIEEYSTEFSFDENLALTKQKYSSPEWILNKYPNSFALSLTNVNSDHLDFSEGDIGFFNQTLQPNPNDLVLIEQDGLRIVRFSEGMNPQILAILLMVERRYRE
ncbi:MAG TPA: XRE family transcriptional regulator [bacterium]|nr:XRE family transcriptional regulator [bacterium]